ncbi:MAG TPA: DUF1015 domain-containing protein [bacterium]|nr:DUF1015 domain-containing protein [bacterium]
MARIRPFRGLRPVPDKIQEVASPPYDVLSSEEAAEKARGNPNSFLHVIKPEIDLDPPVDLYGEATYARGGENLRRLENSGIMIQDEKPGFYLYKLRMGDHEQTGLVAVASVEDYEKNIIKKHELTRPDKENDRMNHIDALNAQTGPVFLTHRHNPSIQTLMDEAAKKNPVYDFEGDHGVRHTITRIEEPSLIQRIQDGFQAIPALYVADGHHRSAAAARVRDKRRQANHAHTGEESYNYFLCVIFPDSEMQILDYNRIVTDLGGLTVEAFIERLKERFEVQGCKPEAGGHRHAKPKGLHEFGLYCDGQWYAMKAREGSFDANDPIKQLDVSILQENCLAPVLGIGDPRTDKRIHFVGGIRGLEELERLVDSGKAAAAFALYPTRIHQLLAVADANQVMPPKSTWFEPKLASGVVVHKLD